MHNSFVSRWRRKKNREMEAQDGGAVRAGLLPLLTAEHEALAEKYDRLTAFICEPAGAFDALPLVERMLLHRQHRAMEEYKNVLWQRVQIAHAHDQSVCQEKGS